MKNIAIIIVDFSVIVPDFVTVTGFGRHSMSISYSNLFDGPKCNDVGIESKNHKLLLVVTRERTTYAQSLPTVFVPPIVHPATIIPSLKVFP